MAKSKKSGCAAVFGFAIMGAVLGCIAGPVGAAGGCAIGFLIGIAILSSSKKQRICQICGNPVTYTSYQGTINGKSFRVICSKCKNHVVNKRRRETMSELLD